MLASLGGRAARRSAARLRTEIRRHPRDRGGSPLADRCASGRASATRRPPSFPKSPRRSSGGRSSLKEPVVLDGEIVALDAKGEPTGFQQLQGRIHLTTICRPDATPASATAVADRASSPSTSCATADAIFAIAPLARSGARRSSGCSRATGSRRFASASWCAATAARCTSGRSSRAGKGSSPSTPTRSTSPASGRPTGASSRSSTNRSSSIGGWTEPRQTRTYFGALLLGVYDRRGLVYVGHTGTGFNERELARVMKLLKPLETTTCPFTERPKTNERPHWVRAEARRADQVHRVDRRRQAAASGLPRPAGRQEAPRRGP